MQLVFLSIFDIVCIRMDHKALLQTFKDFGVSLPKFLNSLPYRVCRFINLISSCVHHNIMLVDVLHMAYIERIMGVCD